MLLLPFPAIAAAEAADKKARVEEVEFVSHGATLSGSIVFPANGKPHAAIVFIHGSGEQTRNLHWAERFAANGIAALVYDKRGVGKSGGQYEGNQSVSGQNISLLADDASAALNALTRNTSLRNVPLGLAGISQAGWIAPVVALENRAAKFLVLWSSPVCKVSEEDIYSKFTADRETRLAAPYSQALASRREPYVWPDFLGVDTDPASSLDSLTIPGLWIFSDNDGSVPVDLSIVRLQALRMKGHPYEYALFSGLGHNNMDGTFSVATDWIARTIH
ncbi:MAG: alpha/beta hydrolase [Pseudomonadota bacterium]